MAKKDIIKRKKGEIIHEAKIEEKEFNNQFKIKIGLILILIGVVLFSMLFI